MGKIIAVNGKGGTGKTTIASLIVERLIFGKAGSVLAIDADPNSCLADSLGVRNARTIVGICEEVSKNIDKIPAGMTKDRYIELEVQEAVIEDKGFDLLVMGRPEGPGCYCYVNSLLRAIIARITSGYDYVVIDNAAGMEHISRRTVGDITNLVLVSDYSAAGVKAAKRIYDLAREMGIKINKSCLILNKVTGPIAALKSELDNTGLELAGDIAYDDELVSWNISNKPVFEFKNKEILSKMDEVLNRIVGCCDAGRSSKRKI